ncbi:poly (A) polymerase regulatory [Brachionus plicatilis]|uniref:Poly (A) polymerase regulatory n=1 Tax=Brachionus plicatilis TaxID=10195 RepID=A0A3M7RWP2_BRAPC|nr:poly (A) polymerase regulatory [Brachionus plicatilis]
MKKNKTLEKKIIFYNNVNRHFEIYAIFKLIRYCSICVFVMDKPEYSPHILQNSDSKYITEPFGWSNRILDYENYPSNLEYKPKSSNEDTTVVHYGRYQLLVNEIEFLILTLQDLSKDYSVDELKNKKIIVIYGGAAIGSHLHIFSNFFPFIKFILYDRAPFKLGLEIDRSKFIIKESFLNAKIANELKDEYNNQENYIRLFISDIRRNNHEKTVEQDMDLQAEIHGALKPYRSYLKFRLPYYNNGTRLSKKYLDGVIYFLAFGNRSTTETRLFVKKDSGLKDYDCRIFENQMYYFNKFDRTNCYKHEINVPGFDHCYDCRTVVFILEEYKKIVEQNEFLFPSNFVIGRKSTKELIDFINRKLYSARKKIEYALNFEQELFRCEYNFTRMKYGTKINREFLNRIIFSPLKINFQDFLSIELFNDETNIRHKNQNNIFSKTSKNKESNFLNNFGENHIKNFKKFIIIKLDST